MGLISKIEDKLAGNSASKEERKLEKQHPTEGRLSGQPGHHTSDNAGQGPITTSGQSGLTGSSFQHPISSGSGPTGSAVGGHGPSMADRGRGEGYGNTQGVSGSHGYSGAQAYSNDKPSMTDRARDAVPGMHSSNQGYSNTPGHSSSQGHSTMDSNAQAASGNQGVSTMPGHSNTHGYSDNQGYSNTSTHNKPSMMERAKEALPGSHGSNQGHTGNQGYSTMDPNYNNKPTMTERARETVPGSHAPQSSHQATGVHGVDQYTSSGQRAAAMAGEEQGVSRTSRGGISNNMNPAGYSSGPHTNMENPHAIPIAGGEKVGSDNSSYGTGSNYDSSNIGRRSYERSDYEGSNATSTSGGTGMGGKARNMMDKVTPGRDSNTSEYGSGERGMTSSQPGDRHEYSRGFEDGDKHFTSSGGQQSQGMMHGSGHDSHGPPAAGHSDPAYEAGFREAMKQREAGYKAAMESMNRGNH